MGDPVVDTETMTRTVAEALAAIRARSPLVPGVALTLGSGLGRAAERLEDATAIPTTELPHWPRSTVPGHAGRLTLGRWRGVPVVALAGRSHRYEGYPLDRVTFAVRVMHALGARTMLFTNAVGALNTDYAPGDLMLARDHINMIGTRGLFTPAELAERGRARSTGGCYDAGVGRALRASASRAGIRLHEGVLMGGKGPSYETAAEVRMARTMGADVACMSTVHEVTLAAHLGCACASLSAITNLATGLSSQPLTHEEVTEVAGRASESLIAIFDGYFAHG